MSECKLQLSITVTGLDARSTHYVNTIEKPEDTYFVTKLLKSNCSKHNIPYCILP